MIHHRPGGMSPAERAKTLKRLGGGVLPNASGATQEAPAILAGSEPSRELVPPKLTPEEIEAVAEANRKARAAAANAQTAADPVNGDVDPLDQVHEAALNEQGADTSAEESTDSLLE